MGGNLQLSSWPAHEFQIRRISRNRLLYGKKDKNGLCLQGSDGDWQIELKPTNAK
jgi:hypothetical protein